MSSKIIVWCLLAILLANIALALGIRPAQTKLDFAPDDEVERVFKIVNDDARELKIKVHTEGDLAKYIELEEEELLIPKEQEITELKFKLKFPKQLPPGELIGDVVVEEDVTALLGEQADKTVSARLQLVHRITVDTNIPDKYIKAEIKYEDKGGKVEIITDVRNFGFKQIDKLQSSLKISDEEKEVKALQTDIVSLLPNASAELKAVFEKSEVAEGQYTVAATVQYDERRLIISRELLVGEPEIELVNFEKYFVAGKINDFKFEARNLWNKALKDVYAVLSVFSGGQELFSSKTMTFDLEPKETEKVQAYLDATDIKPGNYDFALQLHYGNKTFEQKFKGKLFEREDERDRAAKGSKLPVYFVIFALTVLILMVVIIILLTKRNRGAGSYSPAQKAEGMKSSGGWD